VGGDICTICCGTEREVTVNCPLDCEYLQEARRHDKPLPVDPGQLPNRDIRISEKFLAEQESLVGFLAGALSSAALATQGATDFDVRDALDGLVRTYRTLESGVLYESLPQNPLAANIFRGVQEHLAEFRRVEAERLGMSKTRDADILGVLVFFQRAEYDWNNGRKWGRAFIDALWHQGGGPESETPAAPSLIVP
jgi:hypothetical protein